MENQTEKVYAGIGTTDSYDGFLTLQWIQKIWSKNRISIVILHAPNAICKDYVYTPLGKLPASSVCEEKLKVMEKNEQANNDEILSQYMAFCGKIKVKAKVIKIEKNEQPLHQQIVETISRFHITKLVMSLAFMKSPSWKSRNAISGLSYVLREKPDFCEVFVICGGRQVFVRGFLKNDMIHAAAINSNFPDSASHDQWDKYSGEIEQYANELLNEGGQVNVENETLNKKSQELLHMGTTERIRVQSAEEVIQFNRKQANKAKERREKADWAISICNTQAEKLQVCINEEVIKSIDLNKEFDIKREEINELENEVEEKRSKLNSVLELQKELSDKLHLSSSAKACAEVQLQKVLRTRADMVQEIEELRKYRDILQRRIEFCREKEVSKLGYSFDYRQFSAAEIIAATEGFSEHLRIKSAGQSTQVYKGRMNHITVAIKMHDPESFTTKVKLFSYLRHPNVVAMIGLCSDLNCVVYEYMHNGSLHDALISTQRRKQSLSWHTRICIAVEICSALSFLHKTKPKPIIHGNLTPSKVLLDCKNIVKISGLKGPSSYDNELDLKSDIQAFRILVLQLLSGKNWTVTMDATAAIERLDGEWPIDLAMELYGIATLAELPMKELNNVKKRAGELVSNGKFHLNVQDEEDSSDVPGAFLCPINQDIMQNPHLAADGFSYEFEAIDAWLKQGHDTSPMTNLRLKHKVLTLNHTLRFFIEDWKNKHRAE